MKSSQVLFVNPPNKPFTNKNLLIEPIDSLGVASYIESLGHKVSFIDMDVKKMIPQDLIPIFEENKFEYLVLLFDYHIPLHTDEAFEECLKILKIAKACEIKTVIGGKIATYNPEKFSEFADIIIQNEVECALKEILEKKIDKGKFECSIKINLDELPNTNRNLVDLKDYIGIRTILSSRGCPNNCAFCPVNSFWNGWRAKNPNLVVNEIQELAKKGHKKILFLDDNFTVNKKRVLEICKEILCRKIDLTFGCLGSINFIDKELLRNMYNAGFRWIHFGIESGSKKILKTINKNIDLEKAKDIIIFAKKIGFRVRTSFIFDLPKTTKKDLEETAKIILETEPQELRIHFLVLKIGSRLYSESESKENYSQYIHQNYSKNKVIQKSAEEIVQKLEKKGYLVVRNISEWENFEKENKIDFETKIVSFCPLKYGLGWCKNE